MQILNVFSKSAFSYFDPRVTYFWHSDISAFWLCSLRVATWLYFMVSDISMKVFYLENVPLQNNAR